MGLLYKILFQEKKNQQKTITPGGLYNHFCGIHSFPKG